MAFGSSIFLFAVGAILTYAVTAEVENLDLDAVGIILMVVGVVGFLLSALFWASWAPFGRDRYERSEVVHERDGEVVDRELRQTRKT